MPDSPNNEKWTRPLMEAGWQCVPNVILEYQVALGLAPVDVNVLLHLWKHWWTKDPKPYASKESVATAIGVTARTVQRRITRMEKRGLIRRESRGKGEANAFDFSGLIRQATPHANAMVQERKDHQARQRSRAARAAKAARDARGKSKTFLKVV